MVVWIDLANSPHVALFEPVVSRLRTEGATVVLTARDHAQTTELARAAFDEIEIVGGSSPSGILRKGSSVAERARALLRVARQTRPDVALSHGSYAQLLAARIAGVPAVTMMDYEFQPANHLSFRIARRVIVPSVFPTAALRRYGARTKSIVRYDGFKEELYLGTFRPDDSILADLTLDVARVIVVMRPPPEGALYHRGDNERFSGLLADAAARDEVQVVLLPRTRQQASEAATLRGVIVPARAVDGRSLLAHADLMIGAGGTMNREAALLGTPTYTVFARRLAAVDAELIRLGFMHDLRRVGVHPAFEKRPTRDPKAAADRGKRILGTVLESLSDVVASNDSGSGT